MLKIDLTTEKRLRNELNHLKDWREHLDWYIRYFDYYFRLIDYKPNINMDSFYEALNKIKMCVIKEIGQRRNNAKPLGIENRYPNDL